jgi:hypothetical protein
MKEKQNTVEFKVGDKVWFWHAGEGCPVEWEITEDWTIEGSEARKPYNYTKEGRPFSYLVKTIFLSKKECALSVHNKYVSRLNEEISGSLERIKELQEELSTEINELLEIEKRRTNHKLTFLKEYGVESN